MPASVWPLDYKNWQGNLTELVDTANTVLAEQAPYSLPVSVRTARHYQSVGLLGRGDKQGRSAHYGFEDLATLVSAKSMVSKGLPIQYASSLVSNTTTEELTSALAPSAQSSSDVVAQMMKAANLGPMLSSPPPAPRHAFSAQTVNHLSTNTAACAPSLPAAPVCGSGGQVTSASFGLLRGAVNGFAAPAVPSPTSLSPVTWMQLSVDEAALNAAPATERTQAAHALLHLASRLTAPRS